jgi:hypothetical protein
MRRNVQSRNVARSGVIADDERRDRSRNRVPPSATPWKEGGRHLATLCRVGALAIVAALGVAAPGPAGSISLDRSTGIAIGVAAAIAMLLDAASWLGDLLALTAITWFARYFMGSDIGWLNDAASQGRLVHRAVLAHAVLSFPSGRLHHRKVAVVGALYLTALMPSLLQHPSVSLAWACCLAMAAATTVRDRRATMAEARWTIAIGTCYALGLATTALLLAQAHPISVHVARRANTVYCIITSVTAGALVLALGLLTHRRRGLTDAVTELLTDPTKEVRAGLATALGDPHVELLFDIGDRWVDELGGVAEWPVDRPGRQVTMFDAEGLGRVALVHSRSVGDDPELLRSVATATRLAAANVHLRAAINAESVALAASSTRLLSAADLVRSELATALENGPVARLGRVDDALRSVAHHVGTEQDALTRAITHVTAAHEEINGLVLGLDPLSGTGGHLAPALRRLASGGAIPVELDVGVDVDGPVATTLWFVAAEGVANAHQHADATCITVRLHRSSTQVTLEVHDDGHGVVDASRMHGGTGIDGLRDRLRALSGSLDFHSTPHGSTLVAALPVGDR